MKIFLALIFLLIAQSAQAANHWVRADGILGGCLPSATAPATTAGYHSTVAAGVACLSAGDTLNVRAGTYAERIDFDSLSIPSGTSEATRTKIVSYDGPNAFRLAPGSGSTPIIDINTTGLSADPAFITFDGIDFDATGISGVGAHAISSGGRSITFTNFTARGANSNDAVGIQVYGNDNVLSQCKLHDNGKAPTLSRIGYGAYLGGLRTIIANCEVYDNGGYGIHVNADEGGLDNIVVRYNKVHDNGTRGLDGSAGIIIGSGTGIKAYSNEVRDRFGITVKGNCSGCQVFNNTVYNSKIGLYWIGNATITNNIFRNNADNNILKDGAASGTASDNACSGSGGTTNCNGGTDITSDPRFADAANADFRLCTAAGVPNAACVGPSPVIGQGADLSAFFTLDIAGSLRVAPWTMGAHGPGSGVVAPACPATPALVASWGFDGDGTDASGNGNHAVLGSGLTYTAGKHGQALLMNGTAAATVADQLSHYVCSGFTVSGSVYPTTTPTTFGSLIYKTSIFAYASSDVGYGFSSGPMGGYSTNDVAAYAGYSTAFTTNVWTDWAITYDKNLATANLKLWINGTVATTATGTATIAQGTGDLYIGGSAFGEFLPSGWKLDEMRFYNHARTQTQINTDRNTAINPVLPGVDPQIFVRLPASATGLKLAASATAFKISGNIPTTDDALLLEAGDNLVLEDASGNLLLEQ